MNEPSLPASVATLQAYLTHLAAPHESKCVYHSKSGLRTVTRIVTSKYSSISRAVVTIGLVHKTFKFPSPTGADEVKAVLAGIRRTIGTERRKKTALLTADLKTLLMGFEDPESPLAIRDRAILLFGFSGAFRRAELAALNVGDLVFKPQGLLVHLRKSKTDQEGKGRKVAIFRGGAMCPVRAIERWLEVLGEGAKGPLFRPFRGVHVQPGRMRPRVVARVIKRHAEAIGKDPAQFAGHSLRRGFVTQAIRVGESERVIMRTTGHKTSTTIREYIEESRNPFDENASGRLGL